MRVLSDGFLGKGFVAPLAFIRLQTRMGKIVFYQRVFFHKTFITLTALVELLRRADRPGVFRVAICSKCLPY